MLRCVVPDIHEQEILEEDLNLLQLEFFDDESVIVVYRLGVNDGERGAGHIRRSLIEWAPTERTYLAMVKYDNLGYENLQDGAPTDTRENLIQHAIDLLQKGLVSLKVRLAAC